MKKIYNLKQKFFLCFFLIFSGVVSAQDITNVQYDYSCPCKLKVTYDLAKFSYLKLSFSADNTTWHPADTFKNIVPNTNIISEWDCRNSIVQYGVFYFKLDRVPIPCEHINMVFVQGGTYTIGSQTAPAVLPSGTNTAVSGSTARTVSSFYMSQTEVTQSQFQVVLNINPSGSTPLDPCKPVENVSWYAAIAYCNKLSLLEGKTPVYSVKISNVEIDWANLRYGDIPVSASTQWNSATQNLSANGYRLPTESEWEYAARGGTLTLTPSFYYSGGNDMTNLGWYVGNSVSKTHNVSQKDFNALKLYDMSGNVSEWCWDWYATYVVNSVSDYTGPTTGTNRVVRGGSWNDSANPLHVTDRNNKSPVSPSNQTGFRVVTSLDYVLINGVKWAPWNVDAPGTFAATPESAGMFYQYNKKTGWSSTNPITSSPSGIQWSSVNPLGSDPWASANDPSPEGYRVPTRAELNSLLAASVTSSFITQNGVKGIKFTDTNNQNSIFLPAAGLRSMDSWLQDVGNLGQYWSGSYNSPASVHYLDFNWSTQVVQAISNTKSFGYSIRPVVQ